MNDGVRNMDPKQASIAFRTYGCLESFNDLTHALGTRDVGHGDELSLLAVEDQIGRFRLWAGNIGALQEGRSSLDYRLRDAKFIVENVQRLLDSLQASIIGAAHAARRPAIARENTESRGIPSDYDTSSESSGDSGLEALGCSELAQYYVTITEIIGRLFKLSIAIRSPSVQNAAVRSASFVEKDEDGNDLSALFEQYVLQRIVHHFPDLSLRIAERLSRAIGRRRRQFMYQRRHREKLGRARRGEDISATLGQNMESDNLNSSAPHGRAALISEAYVTAAQEPTICHRSILSETTATQYVPRAEQPQAASTKSFSTASGNFQGSEIDIPPPISPNKDQEFECPYCFFILSGEFKEQRTWRKHVFEDLEPYSCLFEDCLNPDQTFSKYSEWVYHEDWSHNLQWCCDLSSHDLQLFDSQDKLEHHLQEAHGEDTEDAGIRQLIERNQRPAPILWTECPFCKFVPDLADVREVSAGFSHEELASKKLVKHIGHHLQSISTLALPWRDDLKDDASSELNESGKAREREAGSQLDAFEVEETDEDDETDLRAYELDLRSITATIDQRWNMNPADFKEVEQDDPVIQHLIFNQTDMLGRLEYQFTPLDPGRIRILRLHPGQYDEPIRFDRLVTSLLHRPAYKYLSYVWGDPSETVSILMADKLITATANLGAALRSIRLRDSTMMLWIDTLCINQADIAERNSQVALMPQIARSASETIVWLGLSTEDSDLAMDFVGRYNEVIMTWLKGSEILGLNKALISLFARPWWNRIWMVQETILSTSVVVRCGSSSIPFEKFVGLRGFQFPQESSQAYQSLIQPIVEMPFGDLLWLWNQLQSEILNGTATLFSIMIATRRLQSSNPCDKVYAPLGLCNERNDSIVVDYGKTSDQVYTEVMRFFLSSEDILPLYIIEEHLPVTTSLPSWVIDWSAQPVRRTGFAFDGKGARRAYRSGAVHGGVSKFRGNYGLADNEVRILREGVHIGDIHWIGEPFGTSGADTAGLASCCNKWWKVYQSAQEGFSSNSENALEGFCRTLVANRLENFVEEPSMTSLEGFESWLGREQGLMSSIFSKKKSPDDRVKALVRRSCTSRTFAVTNRGNPALVPERSQVGDSIIVLLGGDVPFVMRPGRDAYRLVGEAYVHGFMNGEALATAEGSNATQIFPIY